MTSFSSLLRLLSLSPSLSSWSLILLTFWFLCKHLLPFLFLLNYLNVTTVCNLPKHATFIEKMLLRMSFLRCLSYEQILFELYFIIHMYNTFWYFSFKIIIVYIYQPLVDPIWVFICFCDNFLWHTHLPTPN